ncbi:uncharacterized protein [Argopecten irradians]|uniref:uncharacterized protein n=1 Tax=Argopecten irradians TaxID=31199 RepID=UPI003720223E
METIPRSVQSETDGSPGQAFNRHMRLKLWKKAKRVDAAFNSLYDRLRPSVVPPTTSECDQCLETLLPRRLPHGNITEQQMRDSLLADYTMLGKVAGALMKMQEDCEYNGRLHRRMLSAETLTKQLMCQIGQALPSGGGEFPCSPLHPVLMSWCHTDNCFDWNIRNFIAMDKLISTSQAVKTKYNRLLSSHVIRCEH